jgi:hypothetical protein
MAQMLGVAQSVGTNSPFIGVWRVSEVTMNGRRITNLQPNVTIFTQRYYSIDNVVSDAPRPELPSEGASDKQIADAFRLFMGQAGTYEIKGNDITYKPIVAKDPSAMRDGSSAVDTFRMEGKNTLWLTDKADRSGPVANPTTLKLTRVE